MADAVYSRLANSHGSRAKHSLRETSHFTRLAFARTTRARSLPSRHVGVCRLDKHHAWNLVKDRPWHHSFELMPGVRTPGAYAPENLWKELNLADDLSGISLADVGASNGYFSFEARKRGARVVAFDFRHKDNSGFALAQHVNGLVDIEHHHINVLDISQERFGRFNVVLALGLLYHVADPYRALANCASLSSDRLLIESYCIDPTLAASEASRPIMKFIPDCDQFPEHGGVNRDRSNFWGFTSTCLQRMVEDVGFAIKGSDVRGERVFIDAARAVGSSAETRQAIAYGVMPHVPRTADADDPAAWTLF